MSRLGSAAHAVLHPVQFAEHAADLAWHEVASRVMGGATTNEEVFGKKWTDEELRGGRVNLPKLYSKQVMVEKPVKRKEKEPIDTRTPSGKVLPY